MGQQLYYWLEGISLLTPRQTDRQTDRYMVEKKHAPLTYDATTITSKEIHAPKILTLASAPVLRDLTFGMLHSWVGQIVTFFAYSPPSRPLGSLTPTQPGRVTDPTRGCPGLP